MDNLLLKNNYSAEFLPLKIFRLKITDFGLSENVYNQRQGIIKSGNFAGTVQYMAPEILRLYIYEEFSMEEYNPYYADIWALGVCLFEMLTAFLPFQNIRQRKDIYQAQMNKKWRLSRLYKHSYEVNQLLNSLLEPEPMKRLDPCGIVLHSWVQKHLKKLRKNQQKK